MALGVDMTRSLAEDAADTSATIEGPTRGRGRCERRRGDIDGDNLGAVNGADGSGKPIGSGTDSGMNRVRDSGDAGFFWCC